MRSFLVLLAMLPFSLASLPTAAETPPTDAVDAGAATETTAADHAAVESIDRVSLEEIRRFVAVFRAVKQAYVDPIDDATLMRAAIRGLLVDLDPHSAYLGTEESREMNEMAAGAYNGLGLEVVQQPDRTLMVVAPMDDTPAARAGIRPGDVITEIDGHPISADNVDAAVESMRGEPGSSVRLTILRESLREPLTLTLVRDEIRVVSVRVNRIEPRFAYVRISHFQSETGSEVVRKLRQLIDHGPKLEGLVLDLRRNPGGLLNAAVEVADAFLDDGVVVSTRGRLPFSVSEFRAKPGDMLDGAPIVVLVDSGTASAAEVLAAALRDHKRGLIMGSTSFGKGSVQTVLPMDNGESLKLTTARYYTPNGVSIQASGIVPDIEVPEDAVLQVAADAPPSVRERNLPGHLKSDVDVVVAPSPSSAADADDFLVQEALNLLKGLALFERRAPRSEAGATQRPTAESNGERP